ncbi:Protein kinase kin1 [Penicillium diatomitis]|uniref:non-specific serine/threonine protein kinase n=1 Tax=Penicillium diatomitis TaxID=2819901 RepID=A0A9X0BZE5_9EURO|nr:Protein kinase kin1 [Penicillium diatomitis]KAJ5491203.1 Protein kinase kin1 [Penicillium diatomitis]
MSSVPRRTASTSSRPSRAAAPSELPHRTRSVAVRPSNTSQPPFPRTINYAAFDSVGRSDGDTSTRRDRDLSAERPTTARTESSRRHHQRTPSTQPRENELAPVDSAPASASAPGQPKRRTTISTPTGNWALGKTIGAGSMGKVKLAKNIETGEQVAVKIVPRLSTEEHKSPRETERADRSKEIRTAREAAIVSLTNHPYICGMRDVVRTTYHWYMLFEYVNGGQMLDYIISHGKLKEKQARKFARQIASALDYCHRNSIVHRDLKIENILISKTGDIKIIDFGLSNLFSPRSLLKTFCGSLYFAAPELLQARQYTGPEVDVWSFGIVLYVLVCGKVPFDDQSMPQLHAKIKKGVVEYPPGLTAECRHIISRMLVTDPKQRASLAEIMNHPWMNKGFSAPPENYLPAREPLQLPLDQEVIERMTGFDFGSPEYINAQLTKTLESEEYQNAVRLNLRDHPVATQAEKKRGVFDFYKRRNSAASRDTLSAPSAEAIQLGNDPINAYSPLISVYYLVKEKLDNERSEARPGALGLRQPAVTNDVKVPELTQPAAAYTNQYQLPGEKDTGRRSRPRARTHGEDEVTETLKSHHVSSPSTHAVPTAAQLDAPSSKKESTAAGILRRFSTRRVKDRSRDTERDRERVSTPNTPTLNVQPPADSASPIHRGFSVRRTRRAEPSPESVTPVSSYAQQQDLLAAPQPGDPNSLSNKSLGRSTSVNSADYRTRRAARRADADTLDVDRQPPSTSGSDQPPPENQRDPGGAKTAARGHTARTMSLGHARRESIQARRARREATREANVPEETDADITGAGTALESANEAEDLSKPVYLKGLFSVSTTSSKPLPVIRADIIRVLKQLAVDYVEIKGGFSCRHAPSIDLDKVVDVGPPSPERQGQVSHRRRISFGGLLSHDDSRDDSRASPHSKVQRRTHGQPDNSFTTNSDASDEYVAREPPTSNSVGERVVGETTTRVQSDTGENLILRFEILIVKVPLFSLHGIQFKKVSGGMWQYREMAKKILDALRL